MVPKTQPAARKLLWKNLAMAGTGSLVGRTTVHGNSSFRPHSHDFCEMFLVEEGLGRHEINGVFRDLQPGVLVFVRASDAHSLHGARSTGMTFVNVAFAPGLAEFVGRRASEIGKAAFGARRERAPYAVSLSLRARAEFNAALGWLADGPRDRLASECFLLRVLDAARQSMSLDTGKTSLAPEWLASAVEKARTADVFQRGVTGFVKAAGRSAAHVARETRRHYGVSPNQLINEIRLEHAARRLELSSVSITDLSYECGFESLSHFIRLFRRRYAEPPLRYRRRRWGLLLRL